jgi:FAD/FMN-containing dehydrogenase
MDDALTPLAGRVHRPGTPGFDLSAIPTPDLVVSAIDEDDVRAAVRFAADRGMPVGVRATGHGPVPGVDHGLLIDTRALSTVTVDPERRVATAGAGVKWTRVLAECAPLGLIPLCGSSPDVGVASYTLGGGSQPARQAARLGGGPGPPDPDGRRRR